MIYHSQIEQGTEAWLKARIGKVTASELDRIITPLWKAREGDGVATFAYEKASEMWRNYPNIGFSSFVTEQGQELEDEAMTFAALEYEYSISKMGFCESDDGLSGCSPDGLIGETSGVELKCPQPPNHVRYLCEKRLPKDYAAQVHGSMYVTGRPQWVFLSYCRHFPPFHLVVKRDEKVMEKIDAAVKSFRKLLDETLNKIREAQPNHRRP